MEFGKFWNETALIAYTSTYISINKYYFSDLNIISLIYRYEELKEYYDINN